MICRIFPKSWEEEEWHPTRTKLSLWILLISHRILAPLPKPQTKSVKFQSRNPNSVEALQNYHQQPENDLKNPNHIHMVSSKPHQNSRSSSHFTYIKISHWRNCKLLFLLDSARKTPTFPISNYLRRKKIHPNPVQNPLFLGWVVIFPVSQQNL